MNSWDKYFLELAEQVKSRSKDPSTQTGAIIVRPDNTIVSTGYNGFPKRIADLPSLLNNREEKYKRIVHCEMNAILQSKESLEGCTLYTVPFISCSNCAKHVITVGIKRCVAPKIPPHLEERWGGDLELTRSLFKEAGIELVEI